MEPELLTTRELASRLKVSVRTVFRLLAAGTIPARWVLGSRRFYWPEVMAALPMVTPPGARVTRAPPVVDLVQVLKARVKAGRRLR